MYINDEISNWFKRITYYWYSFDQCCATTYNNIKIFVLKEFVLKEIIKILQMESTWNITDGILLNKALTHFSTMNDLDEVTFEGCVSALKKFEFSACSISKFRLL